MELERGDRLAGDGGAQHVGGDERVAVAVATDPRPHADHLARIDVDGEALGGESFDQPLDRRDDVEQAGRVVAQRLVDLVDDTQPREPHLGGLPQRQHGQFEAAIDGGTVRMLVGEPGAVGEQAGNVGEHVEDGLAPHLGRMGGDHRGDDELVDQPAHRVAVEAGALEVVEGGDEAAELRSRAVFVVEAAAPLVMDVLGGVGEERQPAERPDQVQLLVDRPLRQRRGQRVERAAPVTAGIDGAPPHGFDEVEHLVTGLVADDVAEDAPEQPDVGAEGLVLTEHAGHGRAPGGNLSSVPRFEPFPALRYSSTDEPLDVLVAPPYDVLSAEERDGYAAKSPHNIVHVDVPSGGRDRYVGAAALLRQWIADGVLVADAEPSFTIYRMRFTDATGAERDLAGVIGALEVVDEGAGGVLPHERTTPKASTDRLDLTRAARANLSPVWGLSLASGLSGLLAEPGELVGDVTVDGVIHRVERVTDAGRLAKIGGAVAGDDVLIADGHHRYGVARTYRDEVRDDASRADAGSAEAELTLAFVGELVAEQLSVEAIHRLYAGVTYDDVASALAASFDRTPMDAPTPTTLAAMETDGFLVLVGPEGAERLTPKPGAFDGMRAIDGAWLESALGQLPADVDLPARARRDDRSGTAGRRRRRRADPARQRRRDPAHSPRGPADAAEVDVLHAEAAHRLRHPHAVIAASAAGVELVEIAELGDRARCIGSGRDRQVAGEREVERHDQEQHQRSHHRQRADHHALYADRLDGEEQAEADGDHTAGDEDGPQRARQLCGRCGDPLPARLGDVVESIEGVAQEDLLGRSLRIDRVVAVEHPAEGDVGLRSFALVLGHRRPFVVDDAVGIAADASAQVGAVVRKGVGIAVQRDEKIGLALGHPLGVLEALPHRHDHEGEEHAVERTEHGDEKPGHVLVRLERLELGVPTDEPHPDERGAGDDDDEQERQQRRRHLQQQIPLHRREHSRQLRRKTRRTSDADVPRSQR